MSTIAVSANTEHKPILAERFKTKMCRNHVTCGSCPYEQRCMFAHGDDDLRTKEMNLADNLVTEEAIRLFQRARFAAKARAAMHAAAVAAPPSPTVASPRVYRHDPYAQHTTWAPVRQPASPVYAAPPAYSTSSPCRCADCCARTTAAKPIKVLPPYDASRPAVFVP